MDRASFELIGNVGKLEIKPLKGDRHLAIVSLATSERWKAESGDWNEKTYWHRVKFVGRVAGDLHSLAAGDRHHENVPTAIAVGREGDALAIGADVGHDIVRPAAGELRDRPFYKLLYQNILQDANSSRHLPLWQKSGHPK